MKDWGKWNSKMPCIDIVDRAIGLLHEYNLKFKMNEPKPKNKLKKRHKKSNFTRLGLSLSRNWEKRKLQEWAQSGRLDHAGRLKIDPVKTYPKTTAEDVKKVFKSLNINQIKSWLP